MKRLTVSNPFWRLNSSLYFSKYSAIDFGTSTTGIIAQVAFFDFIFYLTLFLLSFLRQIAKSCVPTPQTAKEVIEAFEEDYFSVRSRTGKSETTWKTDYKEVLKRLNPEAPITEEALLSLILATEPDTKARQRTCMACGA